MWPTADIENKAMTSTGRAESTQAKRGGLALRSIESERGTIGYFVHNTIRYVMRYCRIDRKPSAKLAVSYVRTYLFI